MLKQEVLNKFTYNNNNKTNINNNIRMVTNTQSSKGVNNTSYNSIRYIKRPMKKAYTSYSKLQSMTFINNDNSPQQHYYIDKYQEQQDRNVKPYSKIQNTCKDRNKKCSSKYISINRFYSTKNIRLEENLMDNNITQL